MMAMKRSKIRFGSIRLGIFMVMALVPLPAIAAELVPQVRATTSTPTTLIASDVTVRIDVTAPAGSEVTFDSVEGSLGAFEVISINDASDLPLLNLSVADASVRQWTRVLTLQTLALGEQTIPSMTVQVSRGDNTTRLATEPIIIDVQTTLAPDERADLSTFRDIAGEIVIAETAPSTNVLRSLAGTLAAVVFGIIAWLLLRRLRGRDRPLRWCQTRLQKLRNQPITQPSEFIAMADGLKEILWVVTNASTSTKPGNLPMQSTPHCLALLADQDFGEQKLQNLQHVLNTADRMKFSSPESLTRDGLRSAGVSMTEHETASVQRAIADLHAWVSLRMRSSRQRGNR